MLMDINTRVRETPKLELVADLLAKVTGKLESLVKYMKKISRQEQCN